MFCILMDPDDPHYCLAAEEYFLKNFKEDIFMLWQSAAAVVVGKHQNAMGEINYKYLRENNIRLARRISGGGTVFHDEGNVNFTFIKNVSGPQEISFQRFTQPIVEVLASMGVNAVSSGRNDLLVNGLKISGNAEHVFKNRVLHHGTLLYRSDLQNLGNAIRVIPGKYFGKAVQSNRSQVANISGFMKNPPTVADFMQMIMNFQLKRETAGKEYHLTSLDDQYINKLADEKFKTWEWQFGYSPPYSFRHDTTFGGKRFIIETGVERGTIRNFFAAGDVYSQIQKELLVKNATGIPHTFEAIKQLHEDLGIPAADELIYLWF